jgi:hypothetical protein
MYILVELNKPACCFMYELLGPPVTAVIVLFAKQKTVELPHVGLAVVLKAQIRVP